MPRLDRAFPKTFHDANSRVELPRAPSSHRVDPAPMPTGFQDRAGARQTHTIPRSVTLIEPFQLIRRTPPLAWPDLIQTLDDTASRGLARLAARLDRQCRAGRKSLLVTSCARGEGRTTLALCLALRMGRAANARVLLVDADFAKPQLAKRLRLQVDTGLDDVLLDNRSLGGALLESLADGLTLLPLRRSVKETGNLAEGERLSTVLGCIRDAFDLVVIDGGPLFATPELLSAQPAVEHVLLVVDRAISTTNDLERAIRCLSQRGIQVLGAVENFA